MKKLARFMTCVVLLFALCATASADREHIWASGYVEVARGGKVFAVTFVTIHNPNPTGYKLLALSIEG